MVLNEEQKNYLKELNHFDLFYEMSDDDSVFTRGRRQESDLRENGQKVGFNFDAWLKSTSKPHTGREIWTEEYQMKFFEQK